MLKWTRRMHISIYRPAKLKPHGSVCPPFWMLTVEWSGPGRVYFDYVTIFIASFSPSAFSKSIVFKLLHSGGRFRMAPFSVTIFGIVVWTIVVSGASSVFVWKRISVIWYQSLSVGNNIVPLPSVYSRFYHTDITICNKNFLPLNHWFSLHLAKSQIFNYYLEPGVTNKDAFCFLALTYGRYH